MNGGHFRSHVWDPKLLCLQIVAMQCQFYFLFGMWTYLMDIIGRFDASMDQLFTQTVKASNYQFEVVYICMLLFLLNNTGELILFQDLDLLEDSGRVQVIAFLLNSLTR
jgi:hypothetical protein